MKKLLMLTGLLCAAFGLLFAQNFTPLLYEESTLSGFKDWRLNNSGEEKNFKIPVLFNSAENIAFTFIDFTLEEQLEFESEFPWPPMQSGQRVTIYFSAQGPWIWDRRLEAIDYGNGRLVLAEGGTGTLAQNGENRRKNDGSVPPPASSSQSKVPAANPTPDEIASSREIPQEAILPGSTGFNYGRAPQVGSPLRIVVHISGKTPRHGRYYRLQIGSFSVRGNATRAADSLKNAGLNPAFEEYQSNVRVVLPRVPGEDVVETARKIGGAGFSDVWCREEP